MLQLANYVTAAPHGDGGFIGAGSNQQYIGERSLWQTLVRLSALWKEPHTEETVIDAFHQQYGEDVSEHLNKAIDLLKTKNFLIKPDVFEKSERYSRNKLYYNHCGGDPVSVQTNLENSRVVILGCGGIGNFVSYMLATAGVGELVLVDDDHIEASNLTRQFLFTEEDIGKKKTDVLKKELNRRNSNISVSILPLSIDHAEALQSLPECDLLVVSADAPFQLIYWVNEYCVKKRQPYVNIGYINDISVVGPFYIPGQSSCFKCAAVAPNYDKKDPLQDELDIISKDFKPSTFASVNGVAASYAFGDIIKFLGDFQKPNSMNRRIGIHSSKSEFEIQEMPKNEECSVCALA